MVAQGVGTAPRATELPAQQQEHLASFTWELCQCLTSRAGEPEGFTAAGLPVLTPYPQFSAPNDAVVKIKVIYSKCILGTYFVIKTPQCNENKVLVSLSSVYKEGTISGINFKSPPTVLGAICGRLERSKRSSSFDAVFFLLQACRWASSLGAERDLWSAPVTALRGTCTRNHCC